MRQLRVPPEAEGQRLDTFLGESLGSRARAQRLIEGGQVRVEGTTVPKRHRVVAGERIEVDEEETRPEPEAEEAPVEIAFEDDALLVVDKAAGVVVHPARGHRTGTLVNGLLARPGFSLPTPDPRDEPGSMRPGIVHRIDKDTSGLLVVAKDDRAREGLKVQLAQHTVERAYLALTVGTPVSGTIRSTHTRDPRSRLRFTSRSAVGKTATTHVRVLERLAGGRAAYLECRLETGRTHQIRVHLSEQAKTPLLADAVYGAGVSLSAEIAKIAGTLGRQALHAAVLGFIHPVTEQSLHFEVAPPLDFALALSALRALT